MAKKKLIKTLFAAGIIFLLPCTLSADINPRRIVAFWDSLVDYSSDDCLIHQTLEMPLNFLGLDVVYYDVQKPLPDISKEENIRGILIAFQDTTKVPDPRIFIEWAVAAINSGKKVAIMRNPGFLADPQGNYTSKDLLNTLYERIGFIDSQKSIDYTFQYQILEQDKDLNGFERAYPLPLPNFNIARVAGKEAKSYLQIGIPGKPESTSDLIVISPNGGCVMSNYANSYDRLAYSSAPQTLAWYVNPFLFFKLAYGLSLTPIPDPTTLAGRRIYFATCHGDDWLQETAIEEFAGKNVMCSEVILEKVIKPNPDLPIAVGSVAADIDPKWVGTEKSQKVARDYFEQLCVEAASHTYSHPFYWDFFKTGGPEKEIDYLHLYPYGTWQNSFLSWFHAKYDTIFRPDLVVQNKLRWGYVIPRAYANFPFNLDQEISGAVDYINQFTPERNRVQSLIWPGDSLAWPAVLGLVNKAGIKNYGGGFVRFDPEYPSLLFVYPLGRKPGGWIQPYSTANGDNDYTNGWTGNFYGFRYVITTLRNLESPRRLKPIDLYFHSYSGQFQSSVDAILQIIAYVRTQDIIPLSLSKYCEVVEGFYSAEIEQTASSTWKIHDRKGLHTVRFDDVKDLDVDFEHSEGIVGYIDHQGSRYVYLDAANKLPVVSLSKGTKASIPYLIDSRWEIWGVERKDDEIKFETSGWGRLSMRWKMPKDGTYLISSPLLPEPKSIRTREGILEADLPLPNNEKIVIHIAPGPS